MLICILQGDSIENKIPSCCRQTARRICAVCNGVTDPLKHAPPHKCYHAEFGRSRPNRVHMSMEEPLQFGSAGAVGLHVRCLGMGGVADPKHAPSHMCHLAEPSRIRIGI